MHHVGTVEAVEQLTPTLVRIVFGGEGLDGYEPTDHTDEYVNALFVPDGADYAPPFDPEEVRGRAPEHAPRGRRYTVRAWDPDQRWLTIDFVVHGDVGYAGRWAQRARPGDRLQIVGTSGGYRPADDAEWYLLVGDESAVPAIARSLEAVPAGRRCEVIVVVDDAGHEFDLDGPGDVRVRWMHRHGGHSSAEEFVAAVAAIDGWSPNVDVFVHGEAAEVRAVRKFLLAERGVDRANASISPYWRRGQNDEAWREVKRDWLAEQAADV